MDRATRGCIPSIGLQPAFLAKGPYIKPGALLPRHKVIDETLRFAKLLSFEMLQAQKQAMDELLK